jgi:hypothetical protein
VCARGACPAWSSGPSTPSLGPVAQLLLRVTFVPPGEAPAWVREKWVGLKLPLAQPSSLSRPRLGAGVLTGPRGFLAVLVGLVSGRYHYTDGYAVDAPGALAVLEAAHPEAAAWWKKNVPQLTRPGRKLLFQKGVGDVVQ